MTLNPASLLPYLPIAYLLAVALPLARTDLRVHRLPNKFTLPMLPIAFLSQLLAAATSSQWARFGMALGCAFLAAVIGLAVNRTQKLGMGDVKLITGMTWALAWFNPISPLIAISAAFTAATIVVLILFAARKARMGSSIALGPYLLIGFVIALVRSF